MWGNQYFWELKIDQREAFRRLVQAAGRRTHPSLNRVAPGPDDGALTGVIGPEEFCLTFLPLRSPNDLPMQKAFDESQIEPTGRIEIIDGGLSFWRRWFGPQIAFVGRIRSTPTGCRVSGGLRPRMVVAFIPVFMLAMVWPLTSFVFSRLGWPTIVLVVFVSGLVYWISSVLSSGSQSGVGVLRFMDRVWKDDVVR